MSSAMPPRKKVIKPTIRHAPWTVVHADDVTHFKYPPSGNWFTEEHAKRLAEPGSPEHRWVAMPVADFVYSKPGMSIWDVGRAKEAAEVENEENDEQDQA